MAWLASSRIPRHDGLRSDGRCKGTGKCQNTKKKTIERLQSLIRWSIQEIRCLIVRLTQRQIPLEYILHWSRFRRTHQATAYASHLKKQL